jgi:GntR family transcriptional regulator/MocR family aminotransferase
LADYVVRARGLHCRPEQLLVTSGTTHGFRMLLASTRSAGDRIGVEDPGYPETVAAAKDAGLTIVDCPVDQDGLQIDALKLHKRLSIVYVTPSHQYPTGGRLPISRRHALIEWARAHHATVVEDDYDSEFRFDVAPLPALAQLDRERVVHLGTVSKTLGPTLRLGWLVATEDTIARITRYRERAGDWPSWPVQRALLAMVRDGYLDQVVRRGRRRYADRCARVCARLARYGQLTGSDGGLHVTLVLPPGTDDSATARRIRQAGVVVEPLSSYRRSIPGPPGLVIGYAAPSERDLGLALDVVTRTLDAQVVR